MSDDIHIEIITAGNNAWLLSSCGEIGRKMMSDHPLGFAFRKGFIEVAKATMPNGEVKVDWRNTEEYYEFDFGESQ